MRSISPIIATAVLTAGCASSPHQAQQCPDYSVDVDRQIRHLAYEVTRLTSLSESAAVGQVETADEGLALLETIKERKGACLLPDYHATHFVANHETRLRKARDGALEHRRMLEEERRLTNRRRQQVGSAQVLTTTPSLKVELVDFSSSANKTMTVVRLTNLTTSSVLDTRLYRCDREPRRNIWGTRVDTCRHNGVELRIDSQRRRTPISIDGPKSLAPGESRLITLLFPGSVEAESDATLLIRGVTHRGEVRPDLQASLTFPASVSRL